MTNTDTTPTTVRACDRCAREYIAAIDDLESVCAHCELAALDDRRELVQIDCWTDQPDDCILRSDNRGDALTAGRSVETFRLPFAARIFVEPGTDPARAARLLRKAADWIELDPELVATDQRVPDAFPWETR